MIIFPLIKISEDTPFKRGESYGNQASLLISLCIETYRTVMARAGIIWEDARLIAMEHVKWAEEKEGLAEQAEEIKGIAYGSGQDIRDIAIINSRYELLHFPQECTSFALQREVTENNHLLVGQNWDQDPTYATHTVLLDITEEENGNRIFGITEAGQLIRSGIGLHADESVIAICNNSLKSSMDHRGIGCPGNMLRRKLLTMRRMESAVNLITESRRTVSNNFCIGTSENKICDIELLPNAREIDQGVFEVDPNGVIMPTRGIITHDNSITTALQKDLYRHGHPRGTHLKILFTEEEGNINLDYVKKCLSDHEGYPGSICSHGDDENPNWQTIASVIYDLDDKKVHVCCGAPCENEYMEFCL